MNVRFVATVVSPNNGRVRLPQPVYLDVMDDYGKQDGFNEDAEDNVFLDSFNASAETEAETAEVIDPVSVPFCLSVSDAARKDFLAALSKGTKGRTDVAYKDPEKEGLYVLKGVSEEQLEAAMDRVVFGSTISKEAARLNVPAKNLARAINSRYRLRRLRAWQKDVDYDLIRVERLLEISYAEMENDPSPKWAKVILDVLAYRARVLGLEKNEITRETFRIASTGAEAICMEIIKDKL